MEFNRSDNLNKLKAKSIKFICSILTVGLVLDLAMIPVYFHVQYMKLISDPKICELQRQTHTQSKNGLCTFM